MGQYTEETIFICECFSPEHQIVFETQKDIIQDVGEFDTVVMSIHLVKKSFWRRIKVGIKYIFGYKCKYGSFDEVLLQPDDYSKMQKIVDEMKKIYDQQTKKV